jgi:hypothetical protein
MKFTTEDKTEFYSMVKMCVTNGLTFEAITFDGINAPVYEITFTGGF